jgi:hypothetical protein
MKRRSRPFVNNQLFAFKQMRRITSRAGLTISNARIRSFTDTHLIWFEDNADFRHISANLCSTKPTECRKFLRDLEERVQNPIGYELRQLGLL